MMHFSKDWWKLIQIDQYYMYTMASNKFYLWLCPLLLVCLSSSWCKERNNRTKWKVLLHLCSLLHSLLFRLILPSFLFYPLPHPTSYRLSPPILLSFLCLLPHVFPLPPPPFLLPCVFLFLGFPFYFFLHFFRTLRALNFFILLLSTLFSQPFIRFIYNRNYRFFYLHQY